MSSRSVIIAATAIDRAIFEALLAFSQTPMARIDGYEAWRQARAKAMADGHEFYFLGRQPK